MRLKRNLSIAGILVLILIAFIVLIPLLFKGKIVQLVKSEINKSVNAKVDFSDADVSLIRNFPSLSLGLDSLRITGSDEFAGDTLLSVTKFDISINVMSVIRGNTIKINGIELDEPHVLALVTKEGKANWDIFKPDTTAADTTGKTEPLSLDLKKYAIHKGYIIYRDDAAKMSASISNLEHEGSGDFSADIFSLKTMTAADELSFSYGGIPYLYKIKTNIDADIQVDAKNSKYSFQTEKIQLNDLNLGVDGFFQMAENYYNMDIKFKALSTSFKNILSFVPAIYQNNFSSVKTSGDLSFDGFVKGVYSESKIPAYHLNLEVKNGFFQYPDLPKAVKNINFAASVDNPDGITDHTVVNISKGHIEMDRNPFDFRALIKQPVSSLYVDAAAKGKLDLSAITSFVKLQDGTRLKGLLDANVSIKGSTLAVQKKQYEQFYAAGTIALKDFLYLSADYPAGVQVSDLLMTFSPRNVTLNRAAGRYMHSNFTANGSINNILPYLIKNQPLDGVINLTADRIDLNEWMGVSADTSSSAAASAPFVVPASLDVTVNAKAGSVKYDKLEIKDLSGALQVSDETVKIDGVNGKALDGTMGISGSYSTRLNKKKPDISMSYDIKDVSIEKTFYTFNTVQKLMPVGKFLSGKLSSALTLNGKLGESMMPDFSTLTGKGNVLLLEGILSKFKPLESMATTLNISSLQQISVKDIKSYFEFAAGKVLVKPFNLSVKDIDMEVGGLHGLDQSLDYTINMKVPRALMGEKGNTLVNNLVAKANTKGVPLTVADKVDFQVKLGGSFSKPVIKADLKQTATSLAQDIKAQSAQFIQAKVEATKQAVSQAVKDTVASVKKQLVQNAKDELNKKLSGARDTSAAGTSNKKKLEEAGKGLLKNLSPFKKKDTTSKQ